MTIKDLETVEFSMLQAGIDQEEIKRVIDDLKAQIEEAKALREQTPKAEKIKYVVANTSNFNGDIKNLPVMVVEASDEVVWNTIIDEIANAAKEANNDVKKLAKDPIKSIFDAIERVPSKYLKSRNIRVITKELPQVLETDNQLG
jgi:ATP-dependent RNA circularization protein (DNA/RNA ligase family)